MGLQFKDINGVERTLTEADMLLPEFRESYSDLFKGLNGFRPRGDYFMSPSVMLRFFDTYEDEIEAHLEAERHEEEIYKASLEAQFGQSFETLGQALLHREKVEYDLYLQECAAREAEKAHQRELMRRGSPLPVIEAWEYGAI